MDKGAAGSTDVNISANVSLLSLFSKHHCVLIEIYSRVLPQHTITNMRLFKQPNLNYIDDNCNGTTLDTRISVLNRSQVMANNNI